MRLSVRLIRAAVLLLTLCVAASAHAQTYDAFYAFGDSLADNGNDLIFTQRLGANPAVPPSESPHSTYFNGRFSNGYVGFEYLWDMLGGGAPGTPGGLKPFLAAPILALNSGIDFAFGGTGTPFIDQTPGGVWLPGLKGQVELFRVGLLGRKPPKRALYAIVSGANDYRVDQFNTPMAVQAVVANIIDSIETLYSIGARDVLVMDLPDLGLLPSAHAPGVPPEAAAQQTALTQAHNAALETALNALQQRRPKLNLFRGHFAEAFAIVAAQGVNLNVPAIEVIPGAAGTSACLFLDPASCIDAPSAGFLAPFPALPFLFWDIVHPTTAAHQVLADYLFGVITAGN